MATKVELLPIVTVILFFITGFPAFSQEKIMAANYPDWAKNAVIYEVNIRQHTPEGTFRALEKDLPRLKDLGADILWLMPVQPIGEKNRKGRLGSYYSIRDYTSLNPEFGSAEDFSAFIKSAHKKGFKVILDWVANHTAWDHPWITEHPDWYRKDSAGGFVTLFDWTDIVPLDYKVAEMRTAMVKAMAYWIDTYDIDGFRCDFAGLIPLDFWEEARPVLQQKKPLFMLAENEDKPELCMKAFDMNYNWKIHHLMGLVTKGEVRADSVLKLQQSIDLSFPKHAIKMNLITSHDENSWNGTVKEKYGKGGNACAVLTYTLPGMPLMYSGQEAGLDKRLRFFEKDTIDWSDKQNISFYQKLNKFRHTNEAIWSPPYGGILTPIANSMPGRVISFTREKGNNKVFVMANLSSTPLKVTLTSQEKPLRFKDIFSGEVIEIKKGLPVVLQGWQYRLGVLED